MLLSLDGRGASGNGFCYCSADITGCSRWTSRQDRVPCLMISRESNCLERTRTTTFLSTQTLPRKPSPRDNKGLSRHPAAAAPTWNTAVVKKITHPPVPVYPFWGNVGTPADSSGVGYCVPRNNAAEGSGQPSLWGEGWGLEKMLALERGVQFPPWRKGRETLSRRKIHGTSLALSSFLFCFSRFRVRVNCEG